jgi:hypothetical protein
MLYIKIAQKKKKSAFSLVWPAFTISLLVGRKLNSNLSILLFVSKSDKILKDYKRINITLN